MSLFGLNVATKSQIDAGIIGDTYITGKTIHMGNRVDVRFINSTENTRQDECPFIGEEYEIPSIKLMERFVNIFPEGRIFPAINNQIDLAFSPIIDFDTNCIVDFFLKDGEICFRVNSERFYAVKSLQNKVRTLIMSVASIKEQPKQKLSVSDVAIEKIKNLTSETNIKLYSALAPILADLEKDKMLNVLLGNQGGIYFEIIDKGYRPPRNVRKLFSFYDPNQKLNNRSASIISMYKRPLKALASKRLGKSTTAYA